MIRSKTDEFFLVQTLKRLYPLDKIARVWGTTGGGAAKKWSRSPNRTRRYEGTSRRMALTRLINIRGVKGFSINSIP
jgi:hypothetical protein